MSAEGFNYIEAKKKKIQRKRKGVVFWLRKSRRRLLLILKGDSMSRSRESKTLVEIVESFSDINQRACSIAIGYWKWLFFDNSVSVA